MRMVLWFVGQISQVCVFFVFSFFLPSLLHLGDAPVYITLEKEFLFVFSRREESGAIIYGNLSGYLQKHCLISFVLSMPQWM